MTISRFPMAENLGAASITYAEWRQKFLALILRGAIVIGLIVTIFGSINTPLFLVAVYVASYVTILVITFVRLSYRVRAIGFLSAVMAVAISALLETGIRADARMFLVAFVVMGGMLFGRRGGLIAGGVSLIPIGIIGFFIVTGRYTVLSRTVGGNTDVMTWIVAVLVLALVESLILIGLDLLQRGFDTAMQQSQRMFEVLQAERAMLEHRVEARTAQIKTSAEVGRAASSILNSDELLKQIVGLITDRFRFYYAAVFMLDEENQQSVLRAASGEAGQILLERGHRLPLNEESMVGAAIITGHPKVALNVGQDDVRFANPLLPNTRSEIALPLRVSGRNLGALDVQSEQADAFDESNTEVLQTMADQIAVALFNAETYQRSQRQANTMALLNRLSRNLAMATSLEDIASIMSPIVNDLLGQTRLAIVQKTANPQILALREFTPNPDQPVGDSETIAAANSLIGQCVERGEVIYTEDLSELVTHYGDVDSFYQQGLRSSVILPLRIGERVLGAFNVSTDRISAYSPEQINQLEQITSQLAVTVENLNLAEQTQQTLAELDAANRQLIGQSWKEHARTTKLEAAEWRNGAWRVLEDSASRALVPATPDLNVPIKVRGTTIGEFNISAADARRGWDADDVTFAQSLIDQVGQVLETARLLDETGRVAQREKAVADAADKIHRSIDIESVLQSAVTELQRITGRRGISVQLGFGQPAPANNRAPNGQTGGER